MLQLAFQLIKTALPRTSRSESLLQLYIHNTGTTRHQCLLKPSQLLAALAHEGTCHNSPFRSDEQLEPRTEGRQRDSSLGTGNGNTLPSCMRHHRNIVLSFEVLLLLPLLHGSDSYCLPPPKPYTAH